MEQQHIMTRNRNYSLAVYEKAMPCTLTFEELLLSARDCGFDRLEISIDESDMRLERLEWNDSQKTRLIKNRK